MTWNLHTALNPAFPKNKTNYLLKLELKARSQMLCLHGDIKIVKSTVLFRTKMVVYYTFLYGSFQI